MTHAETTETHAAPATAEEREILRQYRQDAEELGRRLLYRAHYGNVRAIAEDVLGAVLDGEIDSTEGLDERIHEEADSACTYTHANLRTLYASEHWEAGLDELGADLLADAEDCGTIFGRLAFYAMRADIRERLELLASDCTPGLDLDDEDTYPANAPELDREAVEASAARTAFVLVWASAEEAEGRTYPGQDLDEAAPEYVPGRFRAWARDAVAGALGAAEATAAEDAWARADAEELGRALALTVGGWTDGLGEADLPRPDGLPSMDADGRLWVDPADFRADAPTIAELTSAGGRADSPEDAAARIRTAIEDESPEDALALANELLGGFGVESLDLPAPDDDSHGGTVRYVNLGDTYCATLAYVEDAYTPNGRYLVTCWGSLVEQAEQERTHATGETRYAYCGDWAKPGDCHKDA